MGWLAILLPVLTTVGYWVFGAQRGGFLGSISESYYTLMRDVFVGTLCIEAFFLYAYRGYNAFEDRFFNGLAFLSVVIALFSMNSKPVVAGGVDAPPSCHYSITMDPTCLIVLNDRVLMSHHEAFGWIHIIAAAILFASLGYVSICLFTKTDCTEPGPEKRRRNTIYRASGIAIWSALALYGLFLAAQSLASGASWVRMLDDWPLLFVGETVCLFAFGFSWLVKGDGVYGLSDSPEQGRSSLRPGNQRASVLLQRRHAVLPDDRPGRLVPKDLDALGAARGVELSCGVEREPCLASDRDLARRHPRRRVDVDRLGDPVGDVDVAAPVHGNVLRLPGPAVVLDGAGEREGRCRELVFVDCASVAIGHVRGAARANGNSARSAAGRVGGRGHDLAGEVEDLHAAGGRDEDVSVGGRHGHAGEAAQWGSGAPNIPGEDPPENEARFLSDRAVVVEDENIAAVRAGGREGAVRGVGRLVRVGDEQVALAVDRDRHGNGDRPEGGTAIRRRGQTSVAPGEGRGRGRRQRWPARRRRSCWRREEPSAEDSAAGFTKIHPIGSTTITVGVIVALSAGEMSAGPGPPSNTCGAPAPPTVISTPASRCGVQLSGASPWTPHSVSWMGCPPTVQSCQMQLSPVKQLSFITQICTDTSAPASAGATLAQGLRGTSAWTGTRR